MVNLSPRNLKTFVQVVAAIFLRGRHVRVGKADSFALYLIALYLSKDEEAKALFEDQLRCISEFAFTVWIQWYDHVVKDNQTGVDESQSELDVQQLLRRLAGENFGKGS